MQKLIKKRIPNWFILAAGMGGVAIALVISAANKPLPEYLVAAANLRPGQILELEDFEPLRLDLGSLSEAYVKSQDLPILASVNSVIRAGELLPVQLITKDFDPAFTSLRFIPGLKPSDSVRAGSWVSVWQVVEVEGVFQTQRLVARAEVSNVMVGEGLFATEVPEVEIVLRIEDSSLVLAALSADLDVYVLPVL